MRPVEQRRDSGVERFERPCVVADVHVLGAVVEPDLPEHVGEVRVEGAAREHAAHRGLPRVAMRVDEPGQDELPGRVHHLGVSELERWADLDDLAVLDQDVGVRQLADVGIHRHDEPASNDQTLAHSSPPRLLCEVFINSVQRD